MTDLLFCPFCGGEAEISKDTIGWYFVRCKTHLCYGRNAVMRFIDEEQAAIAWNTRAERTCHMIVYKQDKDKPRHEQWGVCSECRELLEPSDNYCPNCGAKVINENKPIEVWQPSSADDVTCYEVEQ